VEDIARSVKISAFVVTVGAIALLATGRMMWALGMVIGAAWSAANLIFTVSIMKISVLKKDPARLTALILVKFPVLYLIGFMILNSRAFPVAGLLTGLTIVLATVGIFKLWLKQA
jgi:hypothetical protein